jgi:hypothetical protein
MDQQRDLARGIENRGIDRTPITLFETAAFRGGPAHVIFLHRHRIGRLALQRAHERGPQIADAGGVRRIGIVGKDVEDIAAENLLAAGHRRLEVGVRHRDDRQIGFQDQVKPGQGLEQGLEIHAGWLQFRAGHHALQDPSGTRTRQHRVLYRQRPGIACANLTRLLSELQSNRAANLACGTVGPAAFASRLENGGPRDIWSDNQSIGGHRDLCLSLNR